MAGRASTARTWPSRPRSLAASTRALEPAPRASTEPEKVADLVQLARWINVISFLDLMELSKSIVDSDADQTVPAEVKLSKALATWARATIKATEAQAA